MTGAIQQELDGVDGVLETASEFADSDSFFFIGRRHGMPVSLEGALKLKEISCAHAEEFVGGELKHDTLALGTEDTPALATLTDGANPRETLNNLKEAQSLGATVVGVSSLEEVESYLDVGFEFPQLGEQELLVANV